MWEGRRSCRASDGPSVLKAPAATACLLFMLQNGMLFTVPMMPYLHLVRKLGFSHLRLSLRPVVCVNN